MSHDVDVADQKGDVRLKDLEPDTDRVRRDVMEGLLGSPKSIPSQYLYDARGARLFEKICEQPEYYPPRAEAAILREHGASIADFLGPRVRVIEPGSGDGVKSKVLLGALHDPAGYVPIDISRTQLIALAAEVSEEFEGIEVTPVCADFTAAFEVPEPTVEVRRNVVFFPGSTIGNFEPTEAARVLRSLSGLAGTDGAILVGVDLKKDRSILEPAYDDAAGVSREFALNVLGRLNRELDADFRTDAFDYEAPYDAKAGRIEMSLVSRRSQTVHVGETAVRFAEGERVRTECSYKYDLAGFARVAAKADLRVERVWQDPEELFSLQLLTRKGDGA